MVFLKEPNPQVAMHSYSGKAYNLVFQEMLPLASMALKKLDVLRLYRGAIC